MYACMYVFISLVMLACISFMVLHFTTGRQTREARSNISSKAALVILRAFPFLQLAKVPEEALECEPRGL